MSSNGDGLAGSTILDGALSSSPSRRELLQSIDPYEFEEFVAELWEDQGWQTTVSQDSNDLGVDVEAWKSGMVDQKLAIQAKRYTDPHKVGRPEIQQYHALKEQDRNVDAVVVVTTSDFTDPARVWASQNNIKLVDGDDLLEIIDEHRSGNLLDRYASKEEVKSGTARAESRGIRDKSVGEITIGDLWEEPLVRALLLVAVTFVLLGMVEEALAISAFVLQ